MMDAVAGPLVRARHDLERGRPDRALEALANATAAELETREFWAIRSGALYGLRRWDEAIEAAQNGLHHSPDDLVLLDLVGLAQLESGNKKQALATIEHAIEAYPEEAILHAHRALILMRRRQKSFRLASYRKARAAADEALRIDPTSETALRVRASIAALSRDSSARDYATELLALDPEDERAHAITGFAHTKRGDMRTGLGHFLEAARLQPADPQIAWLGRMSHALQSRFVAPMLVFERLTRGRVRLGWIIVMFFVLHAGQPWLIAAALLFWVYMWAVHFYLRKRVGKLPK